MRVPWPRSVGMAYGLMIAGLDARRWGRDSMVKARIEGPYAQNHKMPAFKPRRDEASKAKQPLHTQPPSMHRLTLTLAHQKAMARSPP